MDHLLSKEKGKFVQLQISRIVIISDNYDVTVYKLYLILDDISEEKTSRKNIKLLNLAYFCLVLKDF